jgi:hypothetical protein
MYHVGYESMTSRTPTPIDCEQRERERGPHETRRGRTTAQIGYQRRHVAMETLCHPCDVSVLNVQGQKS